MLKPPVKGAATPSPDITTINYTVLGRVNTAPVGNRCIMIRKSVMFAEMNSHRKVATQQHAVPNVVRTKLWLFREKNLS